MNELSTELNVAEWQRQIAPLADAASNAERLLAEIEGPLGALYNQAEAAGDEQALGNVMAVWEKSQAIAAQIPPFVAALQGGSATIKELRSQRDAIAAELEDLTQALENYDESDPRIEALAENIQEGIYDWLAWSGEVVNVEDFWETFYQEIIETFDVSYQAAVSLVAALQGDETELDEYRRELIQHLLKSFEDEATPQELRS